MHQTILLVIVASTAFATSLPPSIQENQTRRKHQTWPEIINARRELTECYEHVLHYITTGNATNTLCRDAKDFKNKIEEYSNAEIKYNNRKLHKDDFFINQTIFYMTHRYAKDYYLSISNDTDDDEFYLLKLIFHPSDGKEGMVYNEYGCDKSISEKEKLLRESSIDSTDHLRQLDIDMYDFIIEQCRLHNINHVDRIKGARTATGENTSWMNITTVLVSITAALIFIIILIFIGLIIIVKKSRVYPNIEKDAEELPKKTSIP